MIEEVFSRKSDGMFQWAALHINDLLELESETLVSDYLNALPEGLTATYAQIYDTIDKRKRHVFDTAFQWLIGSRTELTPEELEVAVSQRPDASFSPEIKFDIDFIVATCKNLIHIVTESGRSKRTCQFVHLSVREYFEERHWCPKRANDLVLQTHIRYCIHTLDRDSGALSLWNERMRQWDHQCASFEGRCAPETLELLLEFLGRPKEGSLSFQAWGCSLNRPRYPARDIRRSRGLPGMEYNPSDWDSSQWRQECRVYCIMMGLHDAIRAWLEGRDLKPDARDIHGNTALNIAVEAGHEHICELLLAKGADANLAFVERGRPLRIAAENNNLTVGKLLLAKGGADPNLIDYYGYTTALIAATVHGYDGFVKLLLEHGANPNLSVGSEGIWTRAALLGAASGAIRTGTALLCATSGGHTTIGRMLLEAGAHANLPEDNPPLLHIVIEGMFERSIISPTHLPMTKLLIALGANVNMHWRRFGTPLQIVLSFQYPDPDLVRALRDAGAVYDEARVCPGRLDPELREISGIVDDNNEESWGSDVSNATSEAGADDDNEEAWRSDTSTVFNELV
ncbi:hypothetical protein PG988_011978 [Apiospora saccharicola]